LRKRIPFLFAALLIAALVAVGGVAAFSISGTEAPPEEQSFDTSISGRVGSAILAVSVSSPQPATLPATGGGAPEPEVAAAEPVTSPTTQATTGTTSAPAPSGADTNPPRLFIAYPENGAAVTTSVVEFAGTSEPGAIVSSGPFPATMDENGNWTIKLVVIAGYNNTVFTALDPADNATSVRAVVFYDPPSTPTTTKAPPSPATTKPPAPTTTQPPATTTTNPPVGGACPVSGSCSPNWSADANGSRNVEAWRPLVEKHWQPDRVECVLGIIQLESRGDPRARNSGTNALGLMQHLGKYWNSRAIGSGFVDGNGLTATPYNAEANIAAGRWLADWAQQNQGDWRRPWTVTRFVAACQG
jgi:hypothetical protein